jgi:hypothetical protein
MRQLSVKGMSRSADRMTSVRSREQDENKERETFDADCSESGSHLIHVKQL